MRACALSRPYLCPLSDLPVPSLCPLPVLPVPLLVPSLCPLPVLPVPSLGLTCALHMPSLGPPCAFSPSYQQVKWVVGEKKLG